MSRGLSIFLICVGVIVALSGIVVITITSHWLVGLCVLLIGLIFTYLIYKNMQKNEVNSTTKMKQ